MSEVNESTGGETEGLPEGSAEGQTEGYTDGRTEHELFEPVIADGIHFRKVVTFEFDNISAETWAALTAGVGESEEQVGDPEE